MKTGMRDEVLLRMVEKRMLVAELAEKNQRSGEYQLESSKRFLMMIEEMNRMTALQAETCLRLGEVTEALLRKGRQQ